MNPKIASILHQLKSGTERGLTVTVSPELAQALLDTSIRNRPLRKAAIARYAREIKAKLWNSEAPIFILIDTHGRLIDGHHRLLAVIAANATLDLRFLIGVEPRHLANIDGGENRSLSDRFATWCLDKAVKDLAAGQTGRARQVAAIASFIYKMLTGETRPGQEPATRIVRYYGPSIGFALDNLGSIHLTRNTEILVAVVLAHKHVTETSGIKALKNFVQALATGELLEVGEPAYALRRYLIAAKSGRKNQTRWAKDSQWIVFVKVLWSIRKALEGQIVQKLQPSAAATVIEEFTGSRRELAKQLKLDAVGLDVEEEAVAAE